MAVIGHSGGEAGSLSKIRQLVGYGIGDFGLNIYWNTLNLFLVFWYTDVVGLPPKVAGYVFLVGTVWDAVSDPVVANIAERVETRHGTYRPFLLYGSVGLALSFVLLFWRPPLEGDVLIAVLVVIALLFRTSYTLVAVPYAAMSSRLSYDSVERTEFSGARMFFAFAGLLLVSLLAAPIARQGGDYSAAGFQTVVIGGAVIGTIALLLCFLGTEEKRLGSAPASARITLSLWAKAFRDNRALWLLIVTIFLQSSATASLIISMVFFIDTNQYMLAEKEVVLSANAIATMLGIPVWTLIIRSIGKKVAWFAATLIVAALGVSMLLFGPWIIAGLPLQIVGMSLAMGAFAILLWSFIPDMVEYGQFKSGFRAEGVVFGSVLVVNKLSGGVMAVVITQVLAAIGYRAGVDMQGEVGAGLVTFLAVVPATLLGLSLIPVVLLPVDRHVHSDIVSQLAGGAPRNVEEPS